MWLHQFSQGEEATTKLSAPRHCPFINDLEIMKVILMLFFFLHEYFLLARGSEPTRFYYLSVKIYYCFFKTFREVENLTLQEAFQLRKQHFIYRMKERVQQTKDRRFDENYGLIHLPLRKTPNRKTTTKNNISRSKTVNPGKRSFI